VEWDASSDLGTLCVGREIFLSPQRGTNDMLHDSVAALAFIAILLAPALVAIRTQMQDEEEEQQ
jgi:hypothetical protein